jgi:hypothetical protein
VAQSARQRCTPKVLRRTIIARSCIGMRQQTAHGARSDSRRKPTARGLRGLLA